MTKNYTFENSTVQAELSGGAESVLKLAFANGCKCTVGTSACGAFGEKSGLVRKTRLHRSIDLLEITAETQRVIPFGSEFEIRRAFSFGDGFARITVDAAAGNGGRVESFTLDPVTFEGDWKKVAVDDGDGIRWQEAPAENTVLWESGRTPLRILAESADGALFECGCGEDLWRHNAASAMENCTAKFVVTADSKTLKFERTMFSFAKGDDVEIPKRPWRFSYCLAWSLAPETALSGGKELKLAALDIPESGLRAGGEGKPCFAAPAVRRRLRDAVRSAGESVVVPDVDFGCCTDPSHLERPGKGELLHWDLPELFALYLWGNRQLAKKDLSLRFISAEKSAAAAVLKHVPETFKEEEY